MSSMMSPDVPPRVSPRTSSETSPTGASPRTSSETSPAGMSPRTSSEMSATGMSPPVMSPTEPAMKRIIGVQVMPPFLPPFRPEPDVPTSPPRPGVTHFPALRPAADGEEEEEEGIYMEALSDPPSFIRRQFSHQGSVTKRPAPRLSEYMGQCQRKLGHIDFLPRLSKQKKFGENEFEKFPSLMEAANRWLVENPYAELFSCESVTWTTIDKPVYTDNAVCMRSMSNNWTTQVTRGLRIWFRSSDDTFYQKPDCVAAPILAFTDYKLRDKSQGTSALLSHMKEDLAKQKTHGKTLKLETLHQPSDLKPETCAWGENPENDISFYTFFRRYYRADETCTLGDIMIRDFIPCFNQRSVHSQGYESVADVWKRTARWLHLNPTVNCLNIQSIFVKNKPDQQSEDSHNWERCHHLRHGCAHGASAKKATQYLQLLRVVHTQLNPAAGGSSPTLYIPRKTTYRTFSPQRLRQSRHGSIKENKEKINVSEEAYEDLRQVQHRVNAWIGATDARLCHVETIPTRMRSGGQNKLGAEAMFVCNARETLLDKEPWQYNLRVYVEGDDSCQSQSVEQPDHSN